MKFEKDLIGNRLKRLGFVSPCIQNLGLSCIELAFTFF